MTDQFDDMAREIIEETHRHECEEWKRDGTCTEDRCRCACGATTAPTKPFSDPAWDGTWGWENLDGTIDPLVDVRDSEAVEGKTDYSGRDR